MQVSFIIPLFNCLALTRACIESLTRTLPRDLTHEIILIDDGSTDGTREWLKTVGDARGDRFRVVLNERNRGYAFSNNRAAAAARGAYLILLNNDVVLQPGWLEPLLAAHTGLGARAGVVGNVQRDARTHCIDHAGIIINAKAKPEHARTWPPLAAWLGPRVRRVPAVTGACFLIERALWRELEGFDEGYVNGGEDVDLCYRARQLGRDTVVALDSVILHHVSSSHGRKIRDEENSYRLARRWGDAFIGDATRAWCRDYLAREPRQLEYRLAGRALCHALGWSERPPPEALAGLRAAQQREIARWEWMFRGTPIAL